jgi:hypothetical protein
VGRVGEVDAAHDHVVEGGAARLQDRLHVVHDLTGLLGDRGPDDLVRRGVERHLAGHLQDVALADAVRERHRRDLRSFRVDRDLRHQLLLLVSG